MRTEVPDRQTLLFIPICYLQITCVVPVTVSERLLRILLTLINPEIPSKTVNMKEVQFLGIIFLSSCFFVEYEPRILKSH